MVISKKEQTSIQSHLHEIMKDSCEKCIYNQFPGQIPEHWCMRKDLSCYQNYTEIRKIIDKNYKEA